MIEILNGIGDGTFQPLVLYDPAPSDSSTAGGDLITADFNSDGRPDLALQVRGAFPALHTLINTTNGGSAPPTQAPPAPVLLSPANGARLPINQGIPFSWSAVPGAAKYEIQFDDSSSFSAPLIAAQIGLTQTTQTFTSERRFWWRVRARTAGGINGAWSSVRSFDIKRNAPSAAYTHTDAHHHRPNPDANGSTTNRYSNSNANLCPGQPDVHSCQPDCYAYSHSHSAECHTLTHTNSNPHNRRDRYGIDTIGRVFSRE